MRRCDSNRETVWVNLDEVYIPEHVVERILRRDRQQVERMQLDYEDDRDMKRVVLRPRCGGGYNVEDGRHRVIAAKAAGVGFIEAVVYGD
jgi:hypothetical protein